MLNRSRNADRDIQLRTHLSPGLTNLIAVRTPTVVGHGARAPTAAFPNAAANSSTSLKFSGAKSASTEDDHGRVAEIELRRVARERLE